MLFNHQHLNTHAPIYKTKGMGREDLNIHKNYIPPFFELFVRLNENKNTINLINFIRMHMSLNVLWKF